MFGISAILTLVTATLAFASVDHARSPFQVRGNTNYTVRTDDATGGTISYVTNSGVCETTPGVNQYSGYISFGDTVRNSSLF